MWNQSKEECQTQYIPLDFFFGFVDLDPFVDLALALFVEDLEPFLAVDLEPFVAVFVEPFLAVDDGAFELAC